VTHLEVEHKDQQVLAPGIGADSEQEVAVFGAEVWESSLAGRKGQHSAAGNLGFQTPPVVASKIT